MTPLLAAVVAGCVASTNIESAKDKIQRACGAHLKSVALIDMALPYEGKTEPAENVIAYELTLATDAGGLDMGTAYGGVAFEAKRAAEQMHSILVRLFPARVVRVSFRDSEGRPLCMFDFGADGEMKQGRCQQTVK